MRFFALPVVAVLFLSVALARVQGEEPARKIKVFLLAGQSNMEGKGDGGALTPEEKAAQMHEEKLAPFYADFIGYVHEVLAVYKPDQYEICGMLWVQGEADSDGKNRTPLAADAYGKNLQNLITRARKDIGVPDLPFLLVGVGNEKVVEGMKAAEGSMKNVLLVPRSLDQSSPNFLPQYAMGHYNYEGMKRIGNLLAEGYLKGYADHAPRTEKR